MASHHHCKLLISLPVGRVCVASAAPQVAALRGPDGHMIGLLESESA